MSNFPPPPQSENGPEKKPVFTPPPAPSPDAESRRFVPPPPPPLGRSYQPSDAPPPGGHWSPTGAGGARGEPFSKVVVRGVKAAVIRFRSLKRNTKIGITAVLGVLALCWGTYKYYAYLDRIPNDKDVRTAIERAVNNSSQKLVDVSTKVVSDSGGNTASMKFSATMEVSEPLYTEVPVSRYLGEIGTDAGVYGRIRQIISGPGGDWMRNDAGLTSDVGSATNFVLLRESTKAGNHFNATGDIQARRPVKAWEFQVTNLHFDAAPNGSAREKFTGNVLVLDRPEDVQKFKASLADAQTALTKLEQSQKKYQEKMAKEEGDLRLALLAKLAPGTLFNGTANQGANTPQPLWLEITDIDPNRQTLRAWLRNDGGWDDTRRFEGTFELDTTKKVVNVILKTDASQRVQSCGPFIEWNETYQWSLKLDGDSLTGTGGNWSYKFARLLDDTKKQSEIAFAKDNATKWLAATKAGIVYKLTASIPDRAWSEESFLAFAKQEKDGLVIEAVLEFPSRGYRRTFTGTLITNKYKADGKPLRLLTKGSDAVKQADPESPLAYAADYYLYPQLDDGRMRMDGRWKLDFVPSTNEELAKARLASSSATKPSQVMTPENPGTGAKAATNSGNPKPPSGTQPTTQPTTTLDLDQLRTTATNGDATAQCTLGIAYMNGTGVTKNSDEAAKWLRLSANQGNAPAQYALGQLNTVNNVTNAEGTQWFRKAADQGYAPAQYMVAIFRTTSEKDREKLLKLSADQGYVLAQTEMGVFYTNRKRYPEAIAWYQKAAEQGSIVSCNSLANMYFLGVGVPKDPVEAAKLYRKSADLNDPTAQEILAEMYDSGQGVKKDMTEGFKWHLKAAEQGNTSAQFNVAVAYSNGEGVAKNDTEAVKWLRAAARQGDAEAQQALRQRNLNW